MFLLSSLGVKTELGFWNGLCPLLNRKLYEMHRWLFVLFKILEKWLIGKNNYTVWAVSCKFASVSFDLGFQIWVSWNWLECHWTVFLHWSDCTWLSRLLCIFFFFNLLSWMDSKQWVNSRLSRRKQKIQLNRPLPDTIVFLLLTKIIISSSLKMWGRHAKDIIFILWLFQGWHFF